MADIRRLPTPVTDEWDWQLRAACRGIDNAVFFHPARERGQARADRDERAQQVCRSCPVIDACRRYALAAGEPYGVWGGMTEDDRRTILRHNANRRQTADPAPQPRGSAARYPPDPPGVSG